jgi:RND family efflux transporter MFP subunit
MKPSSMRFGVQLLLLPLLCGTVVAAHAEPLACLIEPDKVAEIGAPGIGIIGKIAVERGDYVKAGQVLISLKDEVETASRNVAAARARVEAELKAANASKDLAQSKVTRSRELVGVGFISKEALDTAETELRIAQNRVGQAEEARHLSRIELDLSNAVLSQRSIRSPFAGLVMDRYRTEGERIEREPILRIAKVDPLRVEVVLSVAQYGQIKTGDMATVKAGIADARALRAKVVLVDRMVDAASNTFRVRLELPNPDNRIPPGLRCNIAFNDDGAPAGVAPAGSTPAGNRADLKLSSHVLAAPGRGMPARAASTTPEQGAIAAVRQNLSVTRLSYELSQPARPRNAAASSIPSIR